MMIFPFHLVLMAHGYCQASEFLQLKRRNPVSGVAKIVMGTGMAAVLWAAIAVDALHLKSFKTLGGAGPWSDAIYKLADHIGRNPDRQFLLMDWGFSAQLLVMNSRHVNFREIYPRIASHRSRDERIRALYSYLLDPANLFVFHSDRFTTEPLFEDFIAAAQRFGFELSFVKPFYQGDGRLIYFLAEVVHPELSASDFKFNVSPDAGAPAASHPVQLINPEVLGFVENSNVKLEAGPAEIRAGMENLHMAVKNLDAPAIDLYYTLNGRNMPVIYNWKLDADHSVSTFVGKETPKGLYAYKAIRAAGDPSPMAWHKVDVTITIK
jgi:hypothetical protein